jgi:hypothetical protein
MFSVVVLGIEEDSVVTEAVVSVVIKLLVSLAPGVLVG